MSHAQIIVKFQEIWSDLGICDMEFCICPKIEKKRRDFL